MAKEEVFVPQDVEEHNVPEGVGAVAGWGLVKFFDSLSGGQ